jgi:hypothetical protein
LVFELIQQVNKLKWYLCSGGFEQKQKEANGTWGNVITPEDVSFPRSEMFIAYTTNKRLMKFPRCHFVLTHIQRGKLKK